MAHGRHENYVEDGDNMFRFGARMNTFHQLRTLPHSLHCHTPDYSVAFLRWALMPPGSRTEWMVRRRVVLP